jgi:GDP-L-fucose synthase
MKMENKLSILLTGGSGFIGKNLVEYLSKNYDVLAPSHSELELTNKIEVDKYFEENKIDVVIHAVNIGGKRNNLNINNSVKDNLKIFFNIVDNKPKVKKIIFLGSGAEYDKTRNIVNVKESEFGKFIPSDDYGFYKYVCSKYIESSDNIINLRMMGIFGKYEDYNLRFISNIICRDLYNLPIEVNQNRVMDYLYIKDFCKIIEYFINNNPKEKFYNLGGGRYDLLSLAEKIKKVSKHNFSITLKKKGLDKEYTCDNTRLLKELKNFKFTEMDVALKEMYDWYKLNKSNINKEELLIY